MSRCSQFSEDRQEPSAERSPSAPRKLGDIARAENWRNPEGVSVAYAGISTVSYTNFNLFAAKTSMRKRMAPWRHRWILVSP